MIYFTSDLHLWHENIIHMQHRPFANVEEMNRNLINNYNETVKGNDTCYILGDICHHANINKSNETIAKLNGHKILIVGNHDQPYDQRIFDASCRYFTTSFNNRYFIMFHYPILSWQKLNSGSIHVHGHIHASAGYNKKNRDQHILRYDVGVDANNYYPVSVYQILDFFGNDILDTPNRIHGMEEDI